MLTTAPVQDVVSVRVNTIKGVGSKSLRALQLESLKIDSFPMSRNSAQRRGGPSRLDAVAASASGAASVRFWAWVVVFFILTVLMRVQG